MKFGKHVVWEKSMDRGAVGKSHVICIKRAYIICVIGYDVFGCGLQF